MSHEELSQDAVPNAEPSMELVGGDATTPAPAGSSLLVKIARGTMYGVVLLGATALLAVSAVPELANYATFIPDSNEGTCAAMAMKDGSCTTLDQVSFEDSSCSQSQETMAVAAESGSCCPFSSEGTEAVLATADGEKSCCSTLSRASLLASQTSASSCCSEGDSCPLENENLATEDAPIDAGSLLAAATAEEPADDQSQEEGAELEPNENVVEE